MFCGSERDGGEALRAVTHAANIRYDKAAEALCILDQSLLPNEVREVRLDTAEEMVEAIRALRVRGAPAIGICAAYGLYRLARTIEDPDPEVFQTQLRAFSAQLCAARPTAVNLAWALGEMENTAAASFASSFSNTGSPNPAGTFLITHSIIPPAESCSFIHCSRNSSAFFASSISGI